LTLNLYGEIGQLVEGDAVLADLANEVEGGGADAVGAIAVVDGVGGLGQKLVFALGGKEREPGVGHQVAEGDRGL